MPIWLVDRRFAAFNWQEYANAGLIDQLSLHHWDQDDEHGADGYHCMLAGGYGQLPAALATGSPGEGASLDVHFNKAVQTVAIENRTGSAAADAGIVSIKCRDGSVYDCDAAVLTVPLGVLKAKQIAFSPPLPDWKQASIDRLGYGWFNKIVLTFPHRFWNANVDSFGSLGPQHDCPTFEAVIRGEMFLFW